MNKEYSNIELGKSKGGRPSGSKNIDSVEYQAFFVKKKFVIPEKELWVLANAKRKFVRADRTEDNVIAGNFLKIYQEQLRDIASRVYPKLKAIDHIRVNHLEGKTLEEQLKMIDELRELVKKRMEDGSTAPI